MSNIVRESAAIAIATICITLAIFMIIYILFAFRNALGEPATKIIDPLINLIIILFVFMLITIGLANRSPDLGWLKRFIDALALC